MRFGIQMETSLWKTSPSTIQVWLVLIELTEKYGHPLVMSFSDISKYSNVCRRVSRRTVSKAVTELEALDMIEVGKRGNLAVITVAGLPKRAPSI